MGCDFQILYKSKVEDKVADALSKQEEAFFFLKKSISIGFIYENTHVAQGAQKIKQETVICVLFSMLYKH